MEFVYERFEKSIEIDIKVSNLDCIDICHWAGNYGTGPYQCTKCQDRIIYQISINTIK